MKVNVTRLKALGANLGPRYVLANIPAARIEAIEDGVAVSRHTAVVGKPDRPSPEINSKIVQINFNPYWTVPPSIVQKDLIPKMQDQPDYLTKNHIRIFDSRQRELQPSEINWYSEDATHYSFKQDPGSLSRWVRSAIDFPERLWRVHARHAAQEPFRRRLPLPLVGLHARTECAPTGRLAAGGNAGWSLKEIDRVIKSGDRKDAQLPKPVPLHSVFDISRVVGCRRRRAIP